MRGTTVRVTHEQKVDADPEKVWALLSTPAALTAMPGHRFAFEVPGTGRLCCLLAVGKRGVQCSVLDVREEAPGQSICWQAGNATRKLSLTLSVRPRRHGCTLAIVVSDVAPVVLKADRANYANYSRRTAQAWAGNLQAIAEGSEPWPPAALPADVREACAGRPLAGKTVQAAGAVLINAALDDVWEMLWAPETSRLMDPDRVVWAGTVPGTPQRAVGELQCFVHRHPDVRFTAAVCVVKELAWGQRAVTQHVGPPWDEVHHVVTPADGGTRLELTKRWPADMFKKAAVAQLADGAARVVQAHADGYKAVIEERAGPSR